ncbi:hypothetical protein CLV24_11748 [Pontibacter ummariensis]|uniref:Por secretion system C-terminal sorting domain-containing protein n=1 Tax=Pontibacter ummariensis TaxID=1610492 RepID=A0A239IGP7_9BACT|nr:T9SS type A sorting domain-containing protein [Pontibacter ummariensis]PRY09844.1 hypothetical protein CLV24_11748 [Pontibacter ummariensis]SNS92840.1 hypothetical protein SAMN06296052_11748 [Pontibacter ummariensis]
MKINLLLTCCLLCLCLTSYGQYLGPNLVNNPGFEEKRDPGFCPVWATASMNPYPAAEWLSIESSDYYHTCASDSVVDPDVNFQGVRSGGNAYSGFVAINKSHIDKSEYLYQSLSTPLRKGVPHYIEFWVSLKDDNALAVSTLGMYLTSDLTEITNKTPLERAALPDQIKTTDVFYDNKTGWTKISGYFTPPTEDIKYFAIGNFDETLSAESKHVKNVPGGATSGESSVLSYYIVDDIVIQEDCTPPNPPYIQGPTVVCDGGYWEVTPPVNGTVSWDFDKNAFYLVRGGLNTNSITLQFRSDFSGTTGWLSVKACSYCGNCSYTNTIGISRSSSACYGGYSYSYYPNPVSDELVVSSEPVDDAGGGTDALATMGVEEYEVRLLSNKGKVLMSGKNRKGEKVVLKVKNVPSGTYPLHILVGEEVFKQQVVVQH